MAPCTLRKECRLRMRRRDIPQAAVRDRFPETPGREGTAVTTRTGSPHRIAEPGFAASGIGNRAVAVPQRAATVSGNRSWIACTASGSVFRPSIARTHASAAGSVVMQGTP